MDTYLFYCLLDLFGCLYNSNFPVIYLYLVPRISFKFKILQGMDAFRSELRSKLYNRDELFAMLVNKSCYFTLTQLSESFEK